MGETSLATCAFAGFGLIARRPLTLVAWWLCALVLFAAAFEAVVLANHASGVGGVVHMSLLAAGPLAWLAGAVLICAVFRSILRPMNRRWLALRVGPDEVRLAPAILVVGAAAAVAILPLLLSGVERLIATAALLLVSPWCCLALPAMFAERRMSLSLGWPLAKGRYFDLLGMNLVTWGIYATLSVVFDKLWKWLVILNDDQIHQAIRRGSGAVALLLAPAAVLAVLIYGALLVIVTAPSAEAYRRLTSPPAPGP